jgi:phage gp36-like protein
MKGSVDARKIGLAAGEAPEETVARRSYQRSLQLLGAIAFGMTLNGLADEGEAVASQVRAPFWSDFEQQILTGFRVARALQRKS